MRKSIVPMSSQTAISPKAKPLPAIRHWLSTIVETIGDWDQRTRTRRALKRLTRSELLDLGITQKEAETEAAKKFWQL